MWWNLQSSLIKYNKSHPFCSCINLRTEFPQTEHPSYTSEWFLAHDFRIRNILKIVIYFAFDRKAALSVLFINLAHFLLTRHCLDHFKFKKQDIQWTMKPFVTNIKCVYEHQVYLVCQMHISWTIVSNIWSCCSILDWVAIYRSQLNRWVCSVIAYLVPKTIWLMSIIHMKI